MRRPTASTLARHATNTAKARGHDLGVWKWATPGGAWGPVRPPIGRVIGFARCLDCVAEAHIDSKPDDGADMSGAAIGMDCHEAKTRTR
jgi:hypothetical protein